MAVVAAVAAAALAMPAVAQVSPPNGPPGAPAAPADGLSLTGSAEALYNSNLLRLPSDVVPPFSEHRDDFRYSPALSATYGRSSGLISVALNGLIGRDFFQYNHYLDRNQYLGGGSLTYHSGSSCQLSVSGNYASRQSGIQTGSSVVDSSGVPVEDVGQVIDNVLTTSTYGANAGCGSPTGRLTFGGGYLHSTRSNAAATRMFGDSDSDTFSGNLGLGILRPGQLSLNGSYTTIVYPNRGALAAVEGLPPALANVGVKISRIGLSFSRPIGTKLNGSIGVSFLHSDPGGGQAAYNSPAYTIALNYSSTSRLTFSLTGSRDIVPSTTAGALFRVADTIVLTGHYQLGEAITISPNAGLIGNTYKQPFAIVGEPPRRSDSTKTLGLQIAFAPRELYDVTLNVQHYIRNSDPTIFEYTSTTAGLTLAVHL